MHPGRSRSSAHRGLPRLLPGSLGLLVVFAGLALLPVRGRCDVLRADPSDYRAKLAGLRPGDRLELAPGEYPGLPIQGLHGEPGRPIEIAGPRTGPRAIITGRACCNTISVRDASYVVLRDLEVDNLGLAVDGFKVEGDASFAHDITLDGLHIHGFGNDQQLVGISTKAPVWNFVIRNSVIEGAGTGLYLGDSDGSDPFIHGLIENNLVLNPLGYCMQIKHQAPRPSRPGIPTAPGVTVIRHNVFIKAERASTGDMARPNLLLGHLPESGAGSEDRYDVYGNFFYENLSGTEGLFQGEGNISFYGNVLVNRHGGGALFQPHNGVPKDVAVFRNTVYVAGPGLTIRGGAPGFTQRVFQNAVFAGGVPISGGVASDDVSGGLAEATGRVARPSFDLSEMDFYPAAGGLEGGAVELGPYADRTESGLDFNGVPYDPRLRGAYGGAGANPGWALSAARKDQSGAPVSSPDAGQPRPGSADAGAGDQPDGSDEPGAPEGGCQGVGGAPSGPVTLLGLGLGLGLLGRARRRRR